MNKWDIFRLTIIVKTDRFYDIFVAGPSHLRAAFVGFLSHTTKESIKALNQTYVASNLTLWRGFTREVLRSRYTTALAALSIGSERWLAQPIVSKIGLRRIRAVVALRGRFFAPVPDWVYFAE